MGKYVLIFVVVIVVVISAIFVSLHNRSDISVDEMALRNTQNESNLLANYAMQYGIQSLNDKSQAPNVGDMDENVPFKKTFATPFNVKGGRIDSLIYTVDDADYVILDAYVTYRSNANVVSTIGRAMLEIPDPDTVRLGVIDCALSAKGKIEIQGKASSKKGIHGDVQSEDEILYQNSQCSIDGNEIIGPFPTFEQIFGMTIQDMKAIADYVGTNPDPIQGITFIEGDFGWASSNCNIGDGNGILVVDGDLQATGGCYFEGIIWVTGEVLSLGNLHVVGAIFAAGVDLTETGGSFLLEFDADLSDSRITNIEGKGPFELLSIFEDFRQ